MMISTEQDEFVVPISAARRAAGLLFALGHFLLLPMGRWFPPRQYNHVGTSVSNWERGQQWRIRCGEGQIEGPCGQNFD